MKAIACEICGSNELVKEDGFFKCQHCQTKYTVEEAKKMMSVKIDNSENASNYIDMAENALSGGNGQEAFDYANKVLEINPKSSKAWLIKMYSLETMGTIGDTRVSEVVICGKNAVQFTQDDERADTESEVYTYHLSRACDLLTIATSNMDDTAHIKSLYEANIRVNLWKATEETINDDAETVQLYSGLVDAALLLKQSVPVEKISSSSSLQDMLKPVVDGYNDFSKALENRFKIYGASLAPEAAQAREEIIAEFADGLLEDVKQEVIGKAQQSQSWAEQGLCSSCGGKLSFFSGKCKSCV